MRTGISIDGGGILGIGSCRFLKDLGYEHEDWLAGTSVGSIIVALRGIGLSWEEVYNTFKTYGPSIFAQAPWTWRYDPRKPEFNNVNLVALLKKFLGTKKMSDLIKPTFITASDFSTGNPKVFDITDSDLVWECVLMSTAAPTYFPPDKNTADGGLWANNPSLVGAAGYQSKHGVPITETRVLSLGTGGDFYQGTSVDENTNKLEWATKIIDFELQATAQAMGFLTQEILGDRYRRVVPHTLKTYAMDNVGVMNEFEAIWANVYQTIGADLRTWLG